MLQFLQSPVSSKNELNISQKSYFNEKDFEIIPLSPLKIERKSSIFKDGNPIFESSPRRVLSENVTIKECQRITLKGVIWGDIEISEGKLLFRPRKKIPEKPFKFGALVNLFLCSLFEFF